MALLFRRYVTAGIVLALAACSAPPALYPPSAPPEVREACAVAQRRCSECHDSDRIVNAIKTRAEWVSTVDRMRQMPGSTIRPEEADVILRCLYYRNDMSAQDGAAPSLSMVAQVDRAAPVTPRCIQPAALAGWLTAPR